MEDYEAQEIEFWAKLEEEGMSRSSMLRRSAAAAVGLTALGTASTALGATRARFAAPPTKETAAGLAQLVKNAKKEGHLNTIALPPDWANYGELISTFQKKYGIKITNDNPDGSSAQENQAIRSLKGDSRAPDAVDVGVSFAIAGANEGLYAKYFNTNYKTIPRSLKDTRGFWMGDYWGAISIGYNKSLVSNPPKTWKDLLKSDYRGKVAMNGSPLSSNSAIAGVLAATLGAGGTLSRRRPRHRLLLDAEEERELHSRPDDSADGRLGPDPDLDRLGLQQPRVRQGVPGRELGRHDPERRRLRRLLRAGRQRDGTASVGGPSVGGVHLLRPGADPLPEGLCASGPVQRPGNAQGASEVTAVGTSLAGALREGEVREPGPAVEGSGKDRG